MIALRDVPTLWVDARASITWDKLEKTVTGLLMAIAAPAAALLVLGGQLVVVCAVVLRAIIYQQLESIFGPWIKDETAGSAPAHSQLSRHMQRIRAWNERSARPPGSPPKGVAPTGCNWHKAPGL